MSVSIGIDTSHLPEGSMFNFNLNVAIHSHPSYGGVVHKHMMQKDMKPIIEEEEKF